jgi:hypothetical protein
MNFSPSESKARRQKVAQIVGDYCHRWYDKNGRWVDTIENPRDARETLWLCFGLLNGSARDLALANAVLGRVAFSLHVPSRSKDEQNVPFDIFVTNHANQLLVLHADKLTDPVRAKMESWARAGLQDHPGNRQSDYQFHGYNDNMPSKATMGMILGGEYFGDAKAVEHGLWNLRQLRSLLTRRGLVSEYTSPTYLPVTLLNLSEIAVHARNEEARALAGQCAERLWADVLGHFHPGTGFMGGPYSRAYQSDSTGHLSPLNGMLWCTFGDAVIPDPTVELTREKIRLVHPHEERSFALGTLAWMVSGDLTPPPHLVEGVNQRRYPFTLRASAERGGGDPNTYSGEVNTTHYQEEDFAIGSSFGDSWSQGQADTWYLQYRRRAPARGPEDVRICHVRYLTNDDVPSSHHGFAARGPIHVLQDGRVALGLSRPSLTLEGKEITSLKLTFVVPVHFDALKKIEVRDGQVFIQDGPLHLALRGLNQTDWGCREAVRLEPVENFMQVSFYNYEGPARKFSVEELGRTLSGFVAVVGLAREESFADFQKRVLGAELVDYFHFDTRTVRYRLGSTLLEAACGVKSDRFRHALVNGRLLPRPIWEADGLPAERLPFLGEPPVPLPMTIPHAHLNVIWGPDSPWMIAARGTEPLPRKIVQGKGWAKESKG